MRNGTFTRSLKCALTQDEKDQAGIRLARIDVEVEEKKDAIKEATAGTKLEIKNLEAERRKLGRSLLDGAMEREVRCEERLSLEDKRVNVHRLDNDTVVESRPATMEELQGNLFTVPAVPHDDANSAGPADAKVLAAEAELRGDSEEAERIRAEAKAQQESPLSDEEKAADAEAAERANAATGTDDVPVIAGGRRSRKKKGTR